MHRHCYNISWDNQTLLYDAGKGIIADGTGSVIRNLGKSWGNRRSEFSGDDLSRRAARTKPICLTIYPTYLCNLACDYCYIGPKNDRPPDQIDLSAVHAAAVGIAQNCRKKKSPFILGFHGGNEPLSRPRLIQECLDICRHIALKNDLAFIPFCTTNGVISSETARWASEMFYGIRLSWDGPSGLHDLYRKTKTGQPTSAIVQQTAAILRSSKLKQLIIRSTITRASACRMMEMVKYLYSAGIRHVEIYPVFQDALKTVPQDLIPTDSEFLENYITAREWARQHEMTLFYSGSRLMERHTRHCPIFLENLTLTPDGYLTACFMASHNIEHQNEQFMYGHYSSREQKLIVEKSKLATLSDRLFQPDIACLECFNYGHCSLGCPSACPMQKGTELKAGTDCHLNQMIGLLNILEAAGYHLPPEEFRNAEAYLSGITVTRLDSPPYFTSPKPG
jgi:uncharacterized protein